MDYVPSLFLVLAGEVIVVSSDHGCGSSYFLGIGCYEANESHMFNSLDPSILKDFQVQPKLNDEGLHCKS